jgi:hypothetical protein
VLLSPARWDREDTVARGGKWGSSLFLGTAGEQSGCLVSSPVSYRGAEGKGGEVRSVAADGSWRWESPQARA